MDGAGDDDGDGTAFALRNEGGSGARFTRTFKYDEEEGDQYPVLNCSIEN